MSLKDEKAADLSGIVAEIGEPVIWNGRTYKAIITSIESSDTLQIGGFGEDYDFTVKIAKAALVAQGRSSMTRSSSTERPIASPRSASRQLIRWSRSRCNRNEHDC